jgi:hypothetical protein
MAAVSNRWVIHRVVGRRGLESLEPVWDDLAAEMPERAWYHSFASHAAYFEHLAPSADGFIGLALFDGERTRAICPLEERVRSILGVRTRVWELPWDVHNLLRDVICPPGQPRRVLLPAVLSHLRKDRKAPKWLVFARVRQGSALLSCADALGRSAVAADPDGAVDVLDATFPASEHSSRRSPKFRRNLNNARNKLAAMPGVRFVNATCGRGLAQEFDTFLELEASGWKGERGTSTAIRLDRRLMAFYRHLLATLPGMEINALYADGKCLASQLNVRCGAEYAGLKLCYNEEYKRLSPGQLLFERTLERCTQDPGIERFNLMSHWEWYQDWKPAVVPVYSVYVPVGRVVGPPIVRLLDVRFRFGPAAKRLVLRTLRRQAPAPA